VIAVADTSPVSYLVLIGEIDLLPALFAEVIVPPGVVAELSDPRGPVAVRNWWRQLPPWIRIDDPGPEPLPEEVRRLHRGEREAILLAQRIGADVVLIDEKAGRRAAKKLGLPVMGLIGVLATASAQGRVDVVQAVERLRRTNFRVAPELLRDLLDRAKGLRFKELLEKVPDVEPEERDRLD
jgi:predicted nucleic acid-binding protein